MINEEGGVEVDDGTIGVSFPLLTASGKGNQEIVTYLLKNNANINQKRSIDKVTALMGAANNDRIKIVETLLKAGAKLDLKDKIGCKTDDDL